VDESKDKDNDKDNDKDGMEKAKKTCELLYLFEHKKFQLPSTYAALEI